MDLNGNLRNTRISSSDHKDADKSKKRYWGEIIWAAIGAAVAIGLALWLVVDDHSMLLLASFGGSTVFFFPLTTHPSTGRCQPADHGSSSRKFHGTTKTNRPRDTHTISRSHDLEPPAPW